MARTPRNYAADTQLSTTVADIIPAVPISVTVTIKKLSFYNSGTSTREVTVHLVEASGTADTGNTLAVKSIPKGKTWRVSEVQGEVMETGMKLQASQDAGTDINANCSADDIT